MCQHGDCECNHGGRHERHHHHRRHCCCCGDGHGFGRRFYTCEERIQMLEAYLGELEREAEGVRERIAELRQT